jgi:YhcH/YjgK/YiaL family protein
MVLDSLTNSSHYSDINPNFEKAFQFLKTADFSKLEMGKHVIDGDDLFVIYMEYESKDPSECKMEKHIKHIDIQYMVEGEEVIGVDVFTSQPPIIPYDDEKDVAFYDNNFASSLKIKKGQFAIFFPHDLHRPCMITNRPVQVKKAVVKIRVR